MIQTKFKTKAIIESKLLEAMQKIDEANALIVNTFNDNHHENVYSLESSKKQIKTVLNKDYDSLARKRKTKRISVAPNSLKKSFCKCNWPLIRTGTSKIAEYCGNCGKDIPK